MSVQRGAHLRRWLLTLPPVEFVLNQAKELLIGSLKCGPIPKHVAFVMDGNRRYARERGLETVEGHHMGFEALARILEVLYKSGVQHVTIYAFSIENFKRSRYEVDGLMDMAKMKLQQMSQHGELLDRYGAAVRILGDRSLVREDVREQIEKAEEMTRHNRHAVLNVCFPYTSREEMTHAVRETVREYSSPLPPSSGKADSRAQRPFSETHVLRNLCTRHLADLPEEKEQAATEDDLQPAASETDTISTSSRGDPDLTSPPHPLSSRTSNSHSPSPPRYRQTSQSKLPDPENITAATITQHTYTHPAPPLDLLIRTSGVRRLSDFMLWQCHERTEIVFLSCLWPEFDLWHFVPALLEWQWRRKKAVTGSKGDQAMD